MFMGTTATKDDLDILRVEIQGSISKAVDDLSDVISALAQNMHTELEYLKNENKEIAKNLNRLTNTIDGFVGRIDRYEAELLARDNQFNRLVEWAHKVSEKTGIPLVDL